MASDQLAASLESYKRDIQELTDQVHSDMVAAVFSNFSKETDYHLIFQGLTASMNQENELELKVGEWKLTTKPKDVRIAELQAELTAATAQVQQFQREMRDIIQFAGDIPADKLSLLRNLIKRLVQLEISGSDKAGSSLSSLNALAACSGFRLKVSETSAANSGLVSSFNALSVSMTKPSEEEVQLKEEIEYHNKLRIIYEREFYTNETETCVVKYAHRPTPEGVPFISSSRVDMSVKRGFVTQVDGKCVVSALHIDNADGSVFDGRSVDDERIGTGTLLMRPGRVFKGAIFDSTSAEGEVREGNYVKKGKFRITTEGNTRTLVIYGPFQVFEGGKLVQSRTKHDDGSMSGWVQGRNAKLTGNWNSEGDFVSGKIEGKDFGCEGNFTSGKLRGMGKYFHKEGLYEGEFLNDEFHGQGKLTTGTRVLNGLWTKGDFTSGVLTNGQTRYEGGFKNGKYHGIGNLQQEGLSYQGAFVNGNLHGQGTLIIGDVRIVGSFYEDQPHGDCTYTKGDVRFQGMYSHGNRHGRGRLTSPGFSYDGDFADNLMHGKGTYQTSNWTYTGDLVKGSFQGKGTWKSRDFTYTGSFANDKFNGYGTIVSADGTRKSGTFKDDKMI